MRHLVKAVLASILLLVMGIGGVFAYIYWGLDPNQLKPYIAQSAREHAQLEVDIEGDLQWSFYPWLGVQVGQTQVRTLTHTHLPPLASIQQAHMSLSLVDLLQGRVHTQDLRIQGLDLQLVQDAQGATNWPQSSAEKTPQEAAPQSEKEAADTFPELQIQSLDIQDARISYQDAHHHWQLEDVFIDSQEISLQNAFPVSVRLALTSQPAQIQAALSLETQVHLDWAQQIYQLEALHAQIKARAALWENTELALAIALPQVIATPEQVQVQNLQLALAPFTLQGTQIQGEVHTDFNLWLTQERLDLTQLRAQLQSQVQATQLPIQLATQGRFHWGKTPYLELKPLQIQVAPTQVQLAKMPAWPLEANVSTQIQVWPQSQQVEMAHFNLQGELQQLPLVLQALQLEGQYGEQISAGTQGIKLQLGELDLQGQLQLQPQSKLTGAIQLKPVDIRQLAQQLGLVLPDMASPETTLRHLSFNTQIGGTWPQIILNPLQAQLDSTGIKGKAQLQLEQGAYQAALGIGALNLDDYLPAETVSEADASTANMPTETKPQNWSFEALQSLNLDLSTRMRSLQVKGVPLEEIQAKVSAHQGQLQINPLKLTVYGGQIQMQAAIDTQAQPARWQLQHQIQGVETQALLQQMADMQLFRGRLSAQGQYQTQGQNTQSLLANLSGELQAQIQQGALQGMNISRDLCNAVALAQNRQLTRTWSQDTEFERLNARLIFQQGKANNPDFHAQIPGLELTGQGDVDLVAQTLDYQLGARFTNTADQHACKVNPYLERIRWPMRCQGPLSTEASKLCQLDTQGLGAALEQVAVEEAKTRAQEKIDAERARAEERLQEKLREKLGEEVGDQIGDVLKGLFR
ncbi:Uncharacterized protein involved in outer membrane biogenesis [Allopseudospirillum japonicum]|uniref:Uncharacterized protein involved in outer membrane biogenesis n=1 Tax=Allopseudospirillum japonicum TaxID=64971 RepID=A0A1H6RE83_9GAMM|nr:AsmA family protein [Allopseudospirillum japonicum]SEI50837.1 Uncharacterized protein involved in outer membrane biogenesis [Allopseudospirillum japonicum]